jgi:hypothetical protein
VLVTGTSAREDTIELRQEEAADLDSLDVYQIRSMKGMEGKELIWRGKTLKLNPTSIRGYVLDENALITRSTCTGAKEPFKPMTFPKDMSEARKVCIYTSDGSWAFVELKEADSEHSKVLIRVVVWDS